MVKLNVRKKKMGTLAYGNPITLTFLTSITTSITKEYVKTGNLPVLRQQNFIYTSNLKILREQNFTSLKSQSLRLTK